MVDSPRKQEGLQRVQIGLTGLAGVVLLVGLANIVIDKARVDQGALPPAVVPTLTDSNSVNAAAAQPKEPLAELGVTPSAEPSLGTGQIVPDLQPDPKLNKRMDREPQQ